jgi:hypothetical protein
MHGLFFLQLTKDRGPEETGSVSIDDADESVSKQTAPDHSESLCHDAAYNNAEIDCPFNFLWDSLLTPPLSPGSKSRMPCAELSPD